MAIERASPTGPHAGSGGGFRQARIPDDFVQQVTERADVYAVVSRSVQLKKSGANNFLGLCPFHTERSPSFTVSPHKGMYYCFGCGAAGSALTFLMEHDGLPFREAVKDLAHLSGLKLPPELSDDPTTATGEVIQTAPIYAAMELAGKFFRHVLTHDAAAKAYLAKRGINAESVRKFGIGAAPDEWRALSEAFPEYESDPVVVQAGLVREKESDSGSKSRYDYFRGRLMFPVRDTRGRVVAFSGRIIGDGEPKYMNSPETPVFHKSGALFGLYEAREAIRRSKTVIAVEGQVDVVSLSQSGIQEVVASMGTAITSWHLERLCSQADTVVFAFDGDAAGRKAAWRALETIVMRVEDHHDVRFLVMPDGVDPDEMVRTKGPTAFRELVRTAPGLSSFLMSELSRRHNGLATTEDRARFASEGSTLASKISYKTRLRRLLLDQIANESRAPGSSSIALRQASMSRRTTETLWTRLAAAAKRLPPLALEHRDVLRDLLDPDNAEEKELLQVLDALQPSPATTGQEKTDLEYLLARDTLNQAVDMIAELREQQWKAELKAQLNEGTITESDFMRQSMGTGSS